MLDEYHLNYPTPVYIGMGLSFMIPFVAVVNNLHVIVEALL
jgi:hypothetical protein